MKTPVEAYGIRIASDPFIHGKHVYFTLNWIEGDEYASSIYRYDGEKMERVTFGNHEKMPVFFRESLYYISYNKETQRLMQLGELSEPREIYSNSSISKFIFHDGSVLVITKDKAGEKDPFFTERIKYRYNGRGLLRSKNKIVMLGEKPETVVEGDFEVKDIASNGKRIIFSATIEDDDHETGDVFELDPEHRTYRKITDGKGSVGPVCVTGAGVVAYLGHREGIKPWATEKLILPESGQSVEIARDASNSVGCDLFVGGVESLIHDNGKYHMIGQEGGSAMVYSYGGSAERLTPQGMSVRGFHVSGENIAYVYTSPEKPSVLKFVNELDLNPDIHGRMPEHIEKDGKEAWALITGKDNPTILSVHGGPHSSYGYAYSVEFNFLADNGFNVIYGNPRGSAGYGEDFAKQCVGDWGGKDFEDLMALLDETIRKYSLKNSLAITGGSYGGFMTNAAITKTDRFRCGISERSVANLFSMCGTSDIGFWFNALESGVDDPWSEEGMSRLREMSPVSHIKNVRTPTMFIHGEEDYRCPVEQSEQMYTGLRMNGIDAALVRYQGDSHEHARHGIPKNMRDRLQRKLDWFTKYCSR